MAVDSTTNGVRLSGAVALQFDGAAAKVPVALLLEYLYSWQDVSDPGLDIEGSTNTLAAGIFYTGRRNLQLGIGGGWRTGGPLVTEVFSDGTTAASRRPVFIFGEFMIRYVW
jgi:hypothetical protein